MKCTPVINFEREYTVCDDGSVYSNKRFVNGRIVGTRRLINWRKLKPRVTKQGYYRLTLCKNGKKYDRSIHRLVAESFADIVPEGLQVAHLDGNKNNNSLKNLKFVTAKENASHKITHGTVPEGKRNGRHTKPDSTPRGEKHGQSKLSWEKVREIRASKEPSRKLGKKYGVSHANILNIKRNKIWSI